MVWINPYFYKIEFMNEIVKKSYLSDETYLFGYIDFFYNFNYVDIEKQLQDDISEQINITDDEQLAKDEKPKEIPLILSNNPDKSNSNLFINKYTIDDESTSINLNLGYRYYSLNYNKSDATINRQLLDSISDAGNIDNIVLKDNTEDSFMYENHIGGEWSGKMDIDNVHENFLHTTIQNKNNLKFLQKLKMTIKMERPNYGLYRFQKVLLELYNLNKLNNKDDDNKKVSDMDMAGQYDDKIIHKFSGEWLITAINFLFNKADGNYQEITLVKRELTKEYTFPRRVKKQMFE